MERLSGVLLGCVGALAAAALALAVDYALIAAVTVPQPGPWMTLTQLYDDHLLAIGGAAAFAAFVGILALALARARGERSIVPVALGVAVASPIAPVVGVVAAMMTITGMATGASGPDAAWWALLGTMCLGAPLALVLGLGSAWAASPSRRRA